MKNNKITAEEQDTDKLGKLFSERKACGQNWLAILCLSSGRHECALHGTYVRATGIEIPMILPPQHRFKLQLILSSVANYLSHVLQ